MRAHADDLRAEVDDDELVAALARDPRTAPVQRISDRARALLDHAEKLTRRPEEVGEDDVRRLRQAGCDDEAIHDLTQVVGFFSYYNRIADGLGCDPEPEWQE